MDSYNPGDAYRLRVDMFAAGGNEHGVLIEADIRLYMNVRLSK